MVNNNRLLELSLAGAWCLAILWLIVLLILLRFFFHKITDKIHPKMHAI